MRSLSSYKVFNLYLPVLVEQCLATVSTMLGTMLVAGLGDYAIASIGMVDQLNFLFINILVCIGTGVTAIVSQRVGSGNIQDAQKSAENAISLAIYGSIIICIFLILFKGFILNMLFGKADPAVLEAGSTYLFYTSLSLPFLTLFNIFTGIRRATGDNFSPLMGSFSSNVCYVGITIFCMKVLDLGINSVGYGLILSRMVSSFILFMFIKFKPYELTIRKLPLKLDYQALKPVLSISIPNAMDSMIFNGGKILVQVFMSQMGTASLSANTIVMSLANLIQLPGRTIQVTCVPQTGRSFGTGDMEKTKKLMLTQVLMSNCTQFCMSIVFYLFCQDIYSFYTQDPLTLQYVKELATMMLIMAPIFWATSFALPGSLRATGDAKFTMRVSATSLFLCRIPLSWLFGVYFELGVHGIWIGMYIDWIFRSVFYFSRIFSKKWHAKPVDNKNNLNQEKDSLEPKKEEVIK
ncbi:MAG: MATE family efflux transporter [bacterium]